MSSRKLSNRVNPATKTIKKVDIVQTSPRLSQDDEELGQDNHSKRYKTFGKPQRKLILDDLRQGLMQLGMRISNPSLFCGDELMGFVKELTPAKYNALLHKILSKHVIPFELKPSNMSVWKRKISGWIRALDKPETSKKLRMKVLRWLGGHANVSGMLLEEFKAELKMIFKNLKIRSFPLLQSKILEILPKYQIGNVQLLKGNECSKHWLFNFMQRHSEIKNIWGKLPLERQIDINGKRKSSKNCRKAKNSQEKRTESPAISEELSCLETQTGISSEVEEGEKEKMDEETNGNDSPSQYFAY